MTELTPEVSDFEEESEDSDADDEESAIVDFSTHADIAFQFASKALKTFVFEGDFGNTKPFGDLAAATEKLAQLLKTALEGQEKKEQPEIHPDAHAEIVQAFGVVWEQLLFAISFIANIPNPKQFVYTQNVGTFAVLMMTFLTASLRVKSTRAYQSTRRIIIDKKINEAYVLFACCHFP